ncbi:hypothetical protein Scep_027438 [Stephania cephalantha]|uniref:Uncharacterized protein n=1 Tax=Stephania cephalantha TaxID=152367 RepID=A0AAP0E809_9MAGN
MGFLILTSSSPSPKRGDSMRRWSLERGIGEAGDSLKMGSNVRGKLLILQANTGLTSPVWLIRPKTVKRTGQTLSVEVCKICEDYSHFTYDCQYYPKYENYHYPSYASPQPDFFGLMSGHMIPQQSTSLEDMMKKLLDDQQRFHEELQEFSREFPSLQNLETQFIQLNVTLQNMHDEKELCNTQPTSYSEVNVDVDTLSNVEENVDTPVENYWCETTQGLEVLQIELDMPIAPNDDDDVALEIGVISERPEEREIESEEDQPTVLVKPPTSHAYLLDLARGWK